jgi:hypothetical protein
MFNQHNSDNRTEVRPLWQLLLAEQTGLLPALTCAEYRALLDFLPYFCANRSRFYSFLTT